MLSYFINILLKVNNSEMTLLTTQLLITRIVLKSSYIAIKVAIGLLYKRLNFSIDSLQPTKNE